MISEKSEIMDFDLHLSLFSKIPVVDHELVPQAKIYLKNTSSKKDLPKEYSFKFKWYKSEKKALLCCKHGSKLATIECIPCGKYGNPGENGYCTPKCYEDDWAKHRVRHAAVPVDGSKCYKDEIYSLPPFESAFQSVSESWSEIGSSKSYTPTLHDSGHRLKIESQAVDCEGLPLTQTGVLVTDLIIIAPAPCPRQMIPVGSNASLEAQPSQAETFRILTYNLLVDYNSLKALSHCHTWALTWEYRRRNLLREIIGYDADILCLQEVQNDRFENFFKPELLKLGYSVSYKEKTGGVFTGKYTTDGCAIFFRDNRFTQIKTSEIEFRKKAESAYKSLSKQQKNTTKLHIWAKDNIAVLVTLKDIKTGTVFCVANTHILANAKATDVKVWQVATLINELEEICNSNIPVLVCADLNSLPGSAPHDLVVKGSVDRNHEDLTKTSFAMFDHLKLHHRMRLVSAYSSILNDTNDILISKDQRDKMDPKAKEPFFTNFTLDFAGAIDYIFYSEEAFTVKSLLELVDHKSFKGYTALPSPYWSSDHIALMAEFYIKLPNTNARK